MADLTGMSTETLRVHGVQYLQLGYAWNGRNRPRKYDRVAWKNMGIARVPFIPQVAAGTGTSLIGDYRYYAVPVNENQVNKNGVVIAGNPSYVSAEIKLNAQGCTISGIPSSHPDSQVTHWYIYRNKAGTYDTDASDTSLDFFYVNKVAIGSTSVTDDLADDLLKDAERIRFNQNIPPTCKYGVLYGDRLFQMGFDAITTPTATVVSKTITNKTKTAGVCLMASASHGYTAGQWVTINIGDFRFDGPAYILSTNVNDFTYHRPGDDVASTVVASGNAQTVTLSSAVPDGVVGCLFQKAGESTVYTIYGNNSTTSITLDRGFSGTLSGSAMRIFRNEYEIPFSEFNDVEAWGLDGELSRNYLELSGKEKPTGCAVWNGKLLIFTPLNIYTVDGKSPDNFGLRISPEPVWKGFGAVGQDSICVDGEYVYAVSPQQGPYRIGPGGQIETFGDKLLTDWLDSLTEAEQGLINMYSNGRCIWLNYPESGNTETSKTFRYDFATQGWWEERPTYARFGLRDDGDGGVQGAAFYVAAKEIYQADYGTTDGGTEYSGAVTTGGTTSFADSGAAFSTSGAGLANLVVRFYDGTTGQYKGMRRISTNAATTVSWASSGAGGGTLTVNINDRYEIGTIAWYWRTRTMALPGHAEHVQELLLGAKELNTSKSLRVQNYVDGTSRGNNDAVTTSLLEVKQRVNHRCQNYYAVVESRNGAALRHITLSGDPKKPNE